MLKLGLWFLGLVALAGAGAWLFMSGALNPLLSEAGLTQEQLQPPSTENASQSQSELTTGTDTSDQALEDDLRSLDAEIDAYGESSAQVDQSLEDQPVTQEY